MDSLEKLFISCLTLFGLFILFMFGLYFDLGDIVAGMLKRGDAVSTGLSTTDYQLRLMEWHGRHREVMPTALMDPAKRRLDSSENDPQVALNQILAISGYFKPLTAKDRMRNRRVELRRLGYTREEYIELEVLGLDRDEFTKVVAQARQLAADKQFQEAARMVAAAIEQVDLKNLYVLRDYYAFLLQLQFDGRQIDKAEETARKLYEILDRTLVIQRVGVGPGRLPEIEAAQARIKAERDRLDEYFAEVKKRTADIGNPNGLYPKERDEMKASLKELRDKGKITEADYQKSLKEVEGAG